MVWCSKHGTHFLGGLHIGQGTGVLFHLGLRAEVCFHLWSALLQGLWGKPVSTLLQIACFLGNLLPPPPWFAMGCGQGERVRITAAAGNGRLGGVEFRWPPVGAGCFGETTRKREPLRLFENLHQVRWAPQLRGAHLFLLKTIRGQHCGHLKPVIKGFLGLAEGRLGRSDLSALCRVGWRAVECDVYGCGIPISHSKQGYLDQSRQCFATGWS